jgi:tetratricopeptide (TPR) repeat protein
MSFFSRWFGGAAAKIADPVVLRERLLEAAARDQGELGELCRAHRETIPVAFATWTVVPAEIRPDKRAVQRYVNGLIAVGRFFAEQLDDPSLLQRLMPPGKDNPLVRWEEGLAEARELMGKLAYAQAEQLLASTVAAMRGSSGTGVDRLLPPTLGALGECLFQQGRAELALAPTTEALALCRQQRDTAGVQAYLGNCYELCRYLGQGEAAAAHAEALAALWVEAGDSKRAARLQARAALARAGEPANRVSAVWNAQEYEVDELPNAAFQGDQTVQFTFERNRITLRPAIALKDQAEALAMDGKYERALALFRAAAAADVHDPGAHFLAGLTLLHLKRHAEAVESFDACEARAPGWFVCRADRWLAQQLASGRLPDGAFLAMNALEGRASPQEKMSHARRAIEQYPRLPGLHLELGKAQSALGRNEAAAAAYRSGLACCEDVDTRTRLLTALGSCPAVAETERRQLLQQAIELEGNLVSAALARWLLRTLPVD